MPHTYTESIGSLNLHAIPNPNIQMYHSFMQIQLLKLIVDSVTQAINLHISDLYMNMVNLRIMHTSVYTISIPSSEIKANMGYECISIILGKTKYTNAIKLFWQLQWTIDHGNSQSNIAYVNQILLLIGITNVMPSENRFMDVFMQRTIGSNAVM